MRRITVAALFLMLFLVACTRGSILPTDPAPSATELPSVTQAPDTEPSVETEPSAGTEPSAETEPATESEATEPVASEPEHSALYIPGVSVEDVILYFNEVCLDSEFINSGDPSFVQKWMVPIYYMLDGSYTEEDIAMLEGFTAWLNQLESFPGIYETDEPGMMNLRISFGNQSHMVNVLGDNFYGMDGGVTFWYRNNCIYDATICYRSDINQYTRNSVILEEIYNGLGPIQDTNLRPDSIIYQGFSEPQALTEIDELILKLLYHPDILPGMNASACEEVIRRLYY